MKRSTRWRLGKAANLVEVRRFLAERQPVPREALNRLSDEIERLRREILSVEEHSTQHLGRLTQQQVELETRIPGLIETRVSARGMFADTTHETMAQRILHLERSLAGQADVILQLREASSKTDQNLQKILIGLERICDQKAQPTCESPPELAPARHELICPPSPQPTEAPERAAEAGVGPSAEPASEPDPIALSVLKPEPTVSKRWPIAVVATLLASSVAVLAIYFLSGPSKASAGARAPHEPSAALQYKTALGEASDSGQAELQTLEARAAGEPMNKTLQLDLAREYMNRKDWAHAESTYRGVLRVDSEDKTALLALSDVLYQQHKYEESATVLAKLTPAKNP